MMPERPPDAWSVQAAQGAGGTSACCIWPQGTAPRARAAPLPLSASAAWPGPTATAAPASRPIPARVRVLIRSCMTILSRRSSTRKAQHWKGAFSGIPRNPTRISEGRRTAGASGTPARRRCYISHEKALSAGVFPAIAGMSGCSALKVPSDDPDVTPNARLRARYGPNLPDFGAARRDGRRLERRSNRVFSGLGRSFRSIPAKIS
jgi:hypothetical protein